MNHQNRGYLYTYDDFLTLIKDGHITGLPKKQLLSLLNPASFDLPLGDTVYILPPNHAAKLWSGVSPKKVLDSLESHMYEKRALTHIVTDPRFSYVIPCPITFRFTGRGRIRGLTNPKSSHARIFTDPRMIFEQSTITDEFSTTGPRIVKPWFVIEPKFINIALKQGMPVSQLRVSCGQDAKLTASEIREIHAKTPIFFEMYRGSYRPLADLDIDENNDVRLRLNLTSRNAKQHLDSIKLHPQKGYLLESIEFVKVPEQLSIQMTQYTSSSVRVITHKGGFFDPGFCGTVVAEVELLEQSPRVLMDKTVLFSMGLFWHKKPTSVS
jgi:deoxycytidine triphosphate deaminase